ncbi:helix-turn-helix transcriptional regulator, partial [Mesorhizobium sp. M2C.T.Ca.TU.002.02.1.1]
MTEENKKKPNPIDIHVGSRIRLRRNMLGMSQEKLGENLGITFQQIQKYEKGTNRVGASRLQAIASILSVPVAFFFEDAPGEETGGGNRGFAEDSSMAFAIE